MIRIEAIVPPFRLIEIREALEAHPIDDLLVMEAKECFEPAGLVTSYRGIECFADFVPCVKVEVYVEDHLCRKAIQAICSAIRNPRVQATILTSRVDKVFDTALEPLLPAISLIAAIQTPVVTSPIQAGLSHEACDQVFRQ